MIDSGVLRVFIGYDSREPLAFHVAAHSLLTRASRPIAVIPLVQLALRSAGLYVRERGPTESTEFSLTRFLTPTLSGFEGLSIFMDCDVLVRCDIYEVLAIVRADRDRSVWVAKHAYTPKGRTKFLGAAQTVYERKNWSSFIVFDNARCRELTPHMVNHLTGLELHRFLWLPDDAIGALPLAWNHLVGEDNQERPPKVVHYTNGSPFLPGYEDCEFADLWRAERDHMLSAG